MIEINLEKILIKIWSELLKIDKIKLRQDFYGLGGSSFLAIQMLYMIKKDVGIELLPSMIIKRPLTINYLVRLLAENKINSNIKKIDKDTFNNDLLNIKNSKLSWSYDESSKIKTVLLTGANGFIGIHLLGSLLANTNYVIYCLVRANNKKLATEKIKSALLFYKLPKYSPKRIKIIEGDLCQKYFGLSLRKYNILAKKINLIIHAGAAVNFEMSYADLKPSNITGTHEVLRFSSTYKSKEIHYISSLAVLGLDHSKASVELFGEDRIMNHKPPQAYGQTKLIAEKNIHHAMANGLKAFVYRLGEVAPSSTTGIPNTRSLHHLFIKACQQIGFYPESSIKIDYLPVDFVCDFIVKVIISQNKKFVGKVFQLCHPHGVSFNQIFKLLINNGSNIKPLNVQKFLRHLRRCSFAKSEVVILKMFTKNFSQNKMIQNELFATFFLKEMKYILTKNSENVMRFTKLNFPILNSKTLAKYVSYLKQ